MSISRADSRILSHDSAFTSVGVESTRTDDGSIARKRASDRGPSRTPEGSRPSGPTSSPSRTGARSPYEGGHQRRLHAMKSVLARLSRRNRRATSRRARQWRLASRLFTDVTAASRGVAFVMRARGGRWRVARERERRLVDLVGRRRRPRARVRDGRRSSGVATSAQATRARTVAQLPRRGVGG